MHEVNTFFHACSRQSRRKTRKGRQLLRSVLSLFLPLFRDGSCLILLANFIHYFIHIIKRDSLYFERICGERWKERIVKCPQVSEVLKVESTKKWANLQILLLIFECLTQSELLRADGCCRAWRASISLSGFWARRTMDLSFSHLVFGRYSSFSTVAIICFVLSQQRFSMCSGLDLSGHEIEHCHWTTIFRTYAFACQVRNLNLIIRNIRMKNSPMISNIMSTLAALCGNRIRSLTITSSNPECVCNYKTCFPNLTCLTLDGLHIRHDGFNREYLDYLRHILIPSSLQHLHIRNNSVLNNTDLCTLLKQCRKLRTLTFVRCHQLKWRHLSHVKLLAGMCPGSIELLSIDVDSGGGPELLEQFWNCLKMGVTKRNLLEHRGL